MMTSEVDSEGMFFLPHRETHHGYLMGPGDLWQDHPLRFGGFRESEEERSESMPLRQRCLRGFFSDILGYTRAVAQKHQVEAFR